MTAEQSSDTGRIVVGFDGSESSTDALAWAVRQAVLTGSTLEVMMTWEWPSSYGWSVPIPDDFDPESDVRKVVGVNAYTDGDVAKLVGTLRNAVDRLEARFTPSSKDADFSF